MLTDSYGNRSFLTVAQLDFPRFLTGVVGKPLEVGACPFADDVEGVPACQLHLLALRSVGDAVLTDKLERTVRLILHHHPHLSSGKRDSQSGRLVVHELDAHFHLVAGARSVVYIGAFRGNLARLEQGDLFRLVVVHRHFSRQRIEVVFIKLFLLKPFLGGFRSPQLRTLAAEHFAQHPDVARHQLQRGIHIARTGAVGYLHPPREFQRVLTEDRRNIAGLPSDSTGEVVELRFHLARVLCIERPAEGRLQHQPFRQVGKPDRLNRARFNDPHVAVVVLEDDSAARREQPPTHHLALGDNIDRLADVFLHQGLTVNQVELEVLLEHGSAVRRETDRRWVDLCCDSVIREILDALAQRERPRLTNEG